MVQFGSIQVSGPLSSEPISDVESDMGPDYSIRISDQFCQVVDSGASSGQRHSWTTKGLEIGLAIYYPLREGLR